MKQKIFFFILIFVLTKICFIFSIKKLQDSNLKNKEDEFLINSLQKKVYNNESDDDIADSIKNLLNNDIEIKNK